MPLEIHPETHAVARGLPAIRALLLRRLFHVLHWRRAHPAFEVGPVLLLETVDTDPSSRRARIHAAVERLIALAHLLPLVPTIAFDDLRHQLFGGDLLEVLFAVAREVAISRRERNPLRHILIGGPILSQPPVQLFLGHAGIDRPHPDAALQLRAHRPDFYRRRRTNERWSPRIAFDQKHAPALPPRPLVHLDGGEAGIHCELHDGQLQTRFSCEGFVQQAGKFLPHCRARGVAFEHPIIDGPRFLSTAPGGNLDLDAVLLDVRARREEQTAAWDQSDLIVLTPVVELLPLRGFAEERPGLAQHCVDEDLKQRWVFLRLLELLGGVAPREPTDRTVQAGDVEARRLAIAFRTGAPLAARQHGVLLVVANLLAAVLANVNRTLRIALWPPQLRELQGLELTARRTWHPVLPLVALLIRRLDPAHAGDLRCRYQKHFAARECACARHRQRDRVALALHITWVSVHLVEEQISRRHRPQADRAVRAGHHQHAPRHILRQTRVARIARPRIADDLPQDLRLLDQRIDALRRVALRHLDGGLHRHHRPRRLVDDVSHPVVAALRAADLRALHEHRTLDGRHGRKAIHDLAQIGRALRAPATVLSGRSLREPAVAVGPLRNGEQRVRSRASRGSGTVDLFSR